MGSGMSREIRFGARTLLVAVLTAAMALQGYLPAVTARRHRATRGSKEDQQIDGNLKKEDEGNKLPEHRQIGRDKGGGKILRKGLQKRVHDTWLFSSN